MFAVRCRSPPLRNRLLFWGCRCCCDGWCTHFVLTCSKRWKCAVVCFFNAEEKGQPTSRIHRSLYRQKRLHSAFWATIEICTIRFHLSSSRRLVVDSHQKPSRPGAHRWINIENQHLIFFVGQITTRRGCWESSRIVLRVAKANYLSWHSLSLFHSMMKITYNYIEHISNLSLGFSLAHSLFRLLIHVAHFSNLRIHRFGCERRREHRNFSAPKDASNIIFHLYNFWHETNLWFDFFFFGICARKGRVDIVGTCGFYCFFSVLGSGRSHERPQRKMKLIRHCWCLSDDDDDDDEDDIVGMRLWTESKL